MKLRIVLPALIGFIFVITLISAETNPCGSGDTFLGTGVKSNNITLKQTCPSCTYVNFSSLIYPNSTQVYFNDDMTKNGAEYTYNLDSFYTSNSGCYIYSVCGDKDSGYECENFNFLINPTGIAPSESRTSSVSRSIYFTLVLGVLFFIAFLFVKSKPPVKWTFFIFGLFFFLITLNILFVGLQDEVVNPRIESFFDNFTAASFYIYWFLAGILAVIWFLTFFQTWLVKKNSVSKDKYGSDY